MLSIMKLAPLSQILGFLLLSSCFSCSQAMDRYTFVVEYARYERLCSSKNILTINGKFPGPTLYVYKGDTIIVDVYNKGDQNLTIHWHGVKQPRYPWSDGPEYITQCPIQPGAKFSQQVVFSSEEGTLWWHAHSSWNRATVHGAIVVYPKLGSVYPFPKADGDVPIIFAEWWKSDVQEVYEDMLWSGGDPKLSDAFTINGQPGALYPCSQSDTYKLEVECGKTYHLRLINSALQDILFFAIANHQLTVVGTDGSYTKPFTSDYIAISPGQTIDVLLEANQAPGDYYMAARAYSSPRGIPFDTTTTTALLQYKEKNNTSSSTTLTLPDLPSYTDTNASVSFTGRFRSLASEEHPIEVPLDISSRLFFTISINTFPCGNYSSNYCQAPNGTRFSASVNNISFSAPPISILEAYHRRISGSYKKFSGVYSELFPAKPPLFFNFTADFPPLYLNTPTKGREVRVLEYNATVEIVFQGTNLVAGADHPMHLHGVSFYVVGWGLGNFDKEKDPEGFNLVDPPLQNTIAVPKNGWSAIRFKFSNPGVWFMHCHIERHMSWGMQMAFIVKNGEGPNAQMLPPPPDMPPC